MVQVCKCADVNQNQSDKSKSKREWEQVGSIERIEKAVKDVNVVKDQIGLRRRSREARKGVQKEGEGFRGDRERGLRRRTT